MPKWYLYRVDQIRLSVTGSGGTLDRVSHASEDPIRLFQGGEG